MKSRNQHYYGEPSFIARLKDEYEFIGRYVEVPEPNHIVIFALVPKKRKPTKEEAAAALKEKTSRKNTYRSSK